MKIYFQASKMKIYFQASELFIFACAVQLFIFFRKQVKISIHRLSKEFF